MAGGGHHGGVGADADVWADHGSAHSAPHNIDASVESSTIHDSVHSGQDRFDADTKESTPPASVSRHDESAQNDSRPDHPPHDYSPPRHEPDHGSPWDGPEGEEAARLLPADDSGYRIQPRDCEFLGISPEQVEAWANRQAPLGMTASEFKEFSSSLYDALAREGFEPEDLDLRLQGSSARFFSGEHKSLPLMSDLIENLEAQSRMDSWLGNDENRPLRRPFDSMYKLGLDHEPSDYDLQISSDLMVEACRRHWVENSSDGDLLSHKYGFVKKAVFQDLFPSLWKWADDWTERTGRPVVPALFPSAGPPDTSWSSVSSHFRDSDWRIDEEGDAPQ